MTFDLDLITKDRAMQAQEARMIRDEERRDHDARGSDDDSLR